MSRLISAGAVIELVIRSVNGSLYMLLTVEFSRVVAMAKNKSKKIIQLSMDEHLLERIDATASIVAKSRAAFIRGARC